jgi:hypothetical protein
MRGNLLFEGVLPTGNERSAMMPINIDPRAYYIVVLCSRGNDYLGTDLLGFSLLKYRFKLALLTPSLLPGTIA